MNGSNYWKYFVENIYKFKWKFRNACTGNREYELNYLTGMKDLKKNLFFSVTHNLLF